MKLVTKWLSCFAIVIFMISLLIVCTIQPTKGSLHTTETDVITGTYIEPEIEPTVEIETELEMETEVKPITYTVEWSGVTLTEEEFNLICTTVYCESGIEPFEVQFMVSLVVLNQISSGQFGNTVHEVIYKENNFAVTRWEDFENRGWTESVQNAVLLALTENPHPRDMYFFRTKYYHPWAKDYMQAGRLYFSTPK